jgi:diacylglycerol kinase family enzyme
LPIGAGARGDDGWLDLLVLQRPGLLNLARYLDAVVSRYRLSDLKRRRVKRVRMWSEQEVPVQVDGDPAGMLPLDVEVVPGALRLALPD